ncbi:ankyrin repeat domain-containing protein [Endozoicomonas sp. SCSIO W0465]|uniref:ankyrin repeat domain-containing protein n=1 Tax=Endozoicomonas sp. SCSIO W0465 TaxID=2918516 RepID=UPI0020755009|nr:ankyrin repeat domain-containing protein [Endozoicomonas sp. SCSIO W0465]USE36700.1 hypothetical protein MJO57_00150 [Endozoicomonas sp. SCSIO W0465]
MLSATLECLKNFDQIDLPVIVCQHLSTWKKAQFDGRGLVVCENPDKLLVRSYDCQCDTLFEESANVRNFDTLLKNRAIDINVRMASYIGCQAWGADNVVHWHGPLQPRDQNILDKLKWYLDQGEFDINQPVNTRQQTLLHLFCQESCSLGQRRRPAPVKPREVVRFLLDNGASVSTRDYLGNTPLHVVSRSGGDSELMANLLEHVNGNSEIIDAVDDEGRTALSVALQYSAWLGKALLLLRAGASTEKHTDGNNPLHYLIYGNNVNTVSLALLVHYGVDIHEQGNEGMLPVNDIARRINNHEGHHLPCIIHLIKMGVALNRVDHCGQSLLSVLFSLDDPDEDGEISPYSISKEDKLSICNDILTAWYKYNFPENTEHLKGALTDSLIERHETDLAQLLEDYPETFYLLDNTVEIIADDLSEHTRDKLENMLVKARHKHSRDMSLLPFVYVPTESLQYSNSDFSTSRMEAIYSASLSDFVRLELEPDERVFLAEDDDIGWDSDETDDGVEIEFSDFYQDPPPADNLAIQLFDIQLYDWLFENHFELLHRLLLSHQSLYKVISTYETHLTDRLNADNKEKLHKLLADIDCCS